MMPVAEMKQIDVAIGDGQHIRFHEAGDGPPVVMVHGAGLGASGAVHFRSNIDAFVSAGHRVIVPDLLGYGGSSKPVTGGYPLERFSNTLADALAALGVHRAAFFGNSLGGAITIDLALRRPDLVSRAILLAPGALEDRATYGALPGVQKMSSIIANGVNAVSMRALLESFVTDPAVITDEVVDARVQAAKSQPAEVTATMVLPNLTPVLGSLTLPMLVIWGVADPICPASGALKFATACPHATVIVYPDVGHWPMAERPDQVNPSALEFLRSS